MRTRQNCAVYSVDVWEICAVAPVPLVLACPLYGTDIAAGFPSPADDYIERSLDLNAFLISHPAATFFVRVAGDSMLDAGIFPGDYLVVDRSLEPVHDAIVIAAIEGELLVKRLYHRGQVMQLCPENPAYPTIQISPETDVQFWGVVSGVIRKTV